MKLLLSAILAVGLFAFESVRAAEFHAAFAVGRVVYIPQSITKLARIFRITEVGDEGSRSVFDQDFREYDFEDDFKKAVVLDEEPSQFFVVEDVQVRSDLTGVRIRMITKRYIDPGTDRVRGYEIDGKMVLATDVAPNATRRFVKKESLTSAIKDGASAVTDFSAGTLTRLLEDTSKEGRAFGLGIIKSMANRTKPQLRFIEFEHAFARMQKDLPEKEASIRPWLYSLPEKRPFLTDGGLDENGVFHPVFNVGRMVLVNRIWPFHDQLFRLVDIGGEGSRSVFDQNYNEYDFQAHFRGAIALNEQPVNYYLTSEIKMRRDLSGLKVSRITKEFADPKTKVVVGYELDGKYVLVDEAKRSGKVVKEADDLKKIIRTTKGRVHLTEEARFSLIADPSTAAQRDLKMFKTETCKTDLEVKK